IHQLAKTSPGAQSAHGLELSVNGNVNNATENAAAPGEPTEGVFPLKNLSAGGPKSRPARPVRKVLDRPHRPGECGSSNLEPDEEHICRAVGGAMASELLDRLADLEVRKQRYDGLELLAVTFTSLHGLGLRP